MKKGLIDIESELLILNTLFSVGMGTALIMDNYKKHYYAKFEDVVTKKYLIWRVSIIYTMS